MKLKVLFFLVCFSLVPVTVFSEKNHHSHPDAIKHSEDKKALVADACEVEIVNYTNDSYTVYGIFDDNSRISFPIYRGDEPHFIDLEYYGYCHQSIYLDVVSFNGNHIFSDYVHAGETLEIFTPYQNKASKAEIKSKSQ